MNSRPYGWLQFASLGWLLALSASLARGEEKGPVQAYRVTLASYMDMETAGQVTKVVANSEFLYNWQRTGNEHTLQFEMTSSKASVNGKERRNSFVSRAKAGNVIDGVANEVLFEDATDELRRCMQDSYDTPFCKLQLDENGKETKRTILAGPGAKTLLGSGAIATARLFHAPFFPARAEWESDSECSMASAGFVKGTLKYSKVATTENRIPVKVVGTLVKDVYRQEGSAFVVKNSRYVVTGEQIYDLSQQEWVSGKRTMDTSYEMINDDKPLGVAKGKMVYAFEKLPLKN